MNWCLSQFNYPANVRMTDFCKCQRPELLLSFSSLRGMENFHLYLWLVKDLSWAQNWYYSGMTFGSLAVSFSFFLMCYAIHMRATNEIFVSAAILIWWASYSLPSFEVSRPHKSTGTNIQSIMKFPILRWLLSTKLFLLHTNGSVGYLQISGGCRLTC